MIASVRALTLAWLDLLRPGIFRVVLLGIALTLALFVALQAAVFWALRVWAPDSITIPWIGPVEIGNALSWGSLVMLPLMAVLLAAPVAAAFAGLFSERVAKTVEIEHGYPVGGSLDFVEGLLDSAVLIAAFLLVTVGVLVLTPFVGPLAPVVFYGANGWLLGREFFQLAAKRHVDAETATTLRQRWSGTVLLLGIGIAVLLTVPILNIVVPVLAAAAYTHLFHILARVEIGKR